MAKFKAKQKGKAGVGKVEKSKKSSSNFKTKKTNSNVKKFAHKFKKKGNFKSTTKEQPKNGNLAKQSHVEEAVKASDTKVIKRKVPSNIDDETNTKKPKKSGTNDTNRLMTIFEQLRRKKTSKDDKHKLVEEVLQLVKDKENQVVFKHDTVRVLEHCVIHGSDKQRGCLFDLFKDNTVLLVTSAGYSKFLVKKFMEYGNKEQKAKIISSFYGKVRKLIKHKEAADILEEIYAKYANSIQRATLTEEFYGPEFSVFKVATGQTFDELIEKEPAKKESIMDFMKTQFVTLCQKDTILHGITHRALLQFFHHAKVSQKQEVYEVLKEKVIHILHTKEGAKVAMNCLWLASSKDRKSILKSFKTFVIKICKEEYGHLVMLALFDVVDDTVLVKKALFPELLSDLPDLVANQYGRKVILYLLKPRSHSYFLPDIIKLLECGDDNPHSKKNAAIRQEELRAAILPELLKTMVPHITDILKNKSVAIVLLAAVECAGDSPELTLLFGEISKIIAKPIKEIEYEEGDDDGPDDKSEGVVLETDHPVCDACGHWVIKSIVQKDKVRVSDGYTVIFSKQLCDLVPAGSFVDWAIYNRGAFVLVSLLETGIDSVIKRIKDDLSLLSKTPNLDNGENRKGIDLLQKVLDKS